MPEKKLGTFTFRKMYLHIIIKMDKIFRSCSLDEGLLNWVLYINSLESHSGRSLKNMILIRFCAPLTYIIMSCHHVIMVLHSF